MGKVPNRPAFDSRKVRNVDFHSTTEIERRRQFLEADISEIQFQLINIY